MTTFAPRRDLILIITSILLVLFAALLSSPAGSVGALQPTPAATAEIALPTAEATSAADALEKLVVRSYPAGMKVYVAPTAKLTTYNGNILNLTSSDFLVGETPLEVTTPPGDYRVTVSNDYSKNPIDFRSDGEDKDIEALSADGKFIPMAKSYLLTKEAGHRAILSSLFWSKAQSLKEFVETLPDTESFLPESATVSLFESTFRERSIPEEDWNDLFLMFRRTGKAIWHGQKPADYLLLYLIELEPRRLFAVQPAK